MIVKKLYRRVKSKWWNKERNVFELTKITDYMGWFLFGFIPIYLIELDAYEEYDLDELEQGTLRPGVIRRYGYLIAKPEEKE